MHAPAQRRGTVALSQCQAVLLLVTLALTFAAFGDAKACETRRTVIVEVEEFIGDQSLGDLNDALIARGRKEALQQ